MIHHFCEWLKIQIQQLFFEHPTCARLRDIGGIGQSPCPQWWETQADVDIYLVTLMGRDGCFSRATLQSLWEQSLQFRAGSVDCKEQRLPQVNLTEIRFLLMILE
jgi:hypothetical protein